MRSVLAIALVFVLGCETDQRIELVNHLPALSKYKPRDVHFSKKLIDPSYRYPYTVYIRFDIDSVLIHRLISDLCLESHFSTDSVDFKRALPYDFYRDFFKMKSIISARISGPNYSLHLPHWFNLTDETNQGVLAGFYLDSVGAVNISNFEERWNGRIVLNYSGNTVFILIDCFG
jgi:hypothetical protein